MMTSINDLIEQCESWISPELTKVFDESVSEDITVKAAYYSLLAGGKRLRPLMMKMTADMFGCKDEMLGDVRYFAASLEMIHTYSLIHDDLPAMDNDDLRRGVPTCHKAYGEGIAVLAGDMLLNRAYERLLAIVQDKPEYAYAAFKLCDMSGINGMVGGQSIDLASEDQHIPLELLYELQAKKTGALIETAVVTPYYLIKGITKQTASTDACVAMLKRLAGHIGLAFQIKDDILDVTSSADVLGKNVGKDMRDDKSTFVTLMGLEGAQEKLALEIEGANTVLNELSDAGYNTDNYRLLVDYLVKRNK